MTLADYRDLIVPMRGSTVGLLAILSVVLAIVLAHSVPVVHGMNDDSMDSHDVISVCLAVLQIGGGIATAFIVRSARRRSTWIASIAPTRVVTAARSPRDYSANRIREGPACQQIFRN